MAQVSLVPKNGAITLTGYLMDFQSFSLRVAQSVENVTPYGANKMTKNVGNGTPDWNISIGAFALAHASGTPLALDTLSAVGAALVATLDTGVTETGALVIESLDLQHSRLRAAVPVAISGKNYGDFVEVWAAT
jgi:hypothetical protein